MASKRIQIIIDDEFLERFDKFADRMQLSRSACISMCCAVTMLMPNGACTLKDRKELSKWLKEYAEKGYKDLQND